MHESPGRKNVKWATKDSISDEMLKEREQILERKLLTKYATPPIVWNKMKYIMRTLSRAAVVGTDVDVSSLRALLAFVHNWPFCSRLCFPYCTW